MTIYISKDDVYNAVDYFKEKQHDELLYMFLILKHLGISTELEMPLAGPAMSKELKDNLIDTIEMIGAIRDGSEDFTKYSILFPSGFSKINNSNRGDGFYQPKSESRILHSRFHDTLKNVRRDKFFDYDERSSSIRLSRDYRSIISDTYLSGDKISLKHLSSWICRFTEFEYDDQLKPVEFSRIIRKFIIQYFRISKRDFDWLIDDDLSLNLINSSIVGTTGDELRKHLAIDERVSEENEGTLTSTEFSKNNYVINRETIEKFREITGDNPSIATIRELLFDKKQIILTGVPGVGKSFYSIQLSCDRDKNDELTFAKTWMIQFHQSYSYEEFVGGETITVDAQTGSSKVTTVKGKLIKAISEAKDQPNKKFLLIIDEINRGNISSIFGETILILDREYSVELPKSINGITQIELPDNLFIIGTMNTSDRNIAFLDLAIRRRFGFVELQPNIDYLSEKIILPVMASDRSGLYNLGAILEDINNNIVNILLDENLRLGQSYFIPNSDSNIWNWPQFHHQFNYVILPTISEYSYSRKGATEMILGDQLTDGIQEISLFKDAFYNRFSEMIIWE